MTLGDLIGKLDLSNLYMELRNEENEEIIKTVEFHSDALTQYHSHEIAGWGVITSSIHQSNFYVRLKNKR